MVHNIVLQADFIHLLQTYFTGTGQIHYQNMQTYSVTYFLVSELILNFPTSPWLSSLEARITAGPMTAHVGNRPTITLEMTGYYIFPYVPEGTFMSTGDTIQSFIADW